MQLVDNNSAQFIKTTDKRNVIMWAEGVGGGTRRGGGGEGVGGHHSPRVGPKDGTPGLGAKEWRLGCPRDLHSGGFFSYFFVYTFLSKCGRGCVDESKGEQRRRKYARWIKWKGKHDMPE